MPTRDPNTILAAQWNSSNVTTPTFLNSPKLSKHILNRGVIQRRLRKEEDYMGIFSRTNYKADSHDAWRMEVISTTEDDVVAIVDEIRRICATFSPTDTEKILQWDGGNWMMYQPHRFEFEFVIFIRKVGIGFG